MKHEKKDFESMLDKAKEKRSLSTSELDLVRTELMSPNTTEDPYTLLHIIGKANDYSALPIVNDYLHYGIDNQGDDGMMRRLAVQILGQWWKVDEAFTEIRGMAFEDPSPLVRAAAASAIGNLALEHPELRRFAAGSLIRGIELFATEQRDVWGSFYVGMLKLVGVDPKLWPVNPGGLQPEDLDPAVLSTINKLAG